MKIKENLLNILDLITLAIAALAWIAVIIVMGVLSRSILYTFLTIIACAAFVFSAYKLLVQHSYETRFRTSYWLLMLAGLFLALWNFSRIGLAWVGLLLAVLALLPILLDRLSKIREHRKLDTALYGKPLTDAERIARATHATNMRDYASALGLNYIPASGPAVRAHSTSQFAAHLTCQHCSKPQAAREWPLNGDVIPFYYQKEPGRHSLKLTCPNCGRDWYVVWDQDPGQIRRLV